MYTFLYYENNCGSKTNNEYNITTYILSLIQVFVNIKFIDIRLDTTGQCGKHMGETTKRDLHICQ